MGTCSYCHLEGEVSNINISVGIAQYPRDGERLGSLVKNADIALYHGEKTRRKSNKEMYLGLTI
ncbi:MHYT domain (predicted integral membrane sensor domain) [Providencia stuartii]|nr:MHYT domain (predicted integral membrane sensor domain) [Providencia stuartii]